MRSVHLERQFGMKPRETLEHADHARLDVAQRDDMGRVLEGHDDAPFISGSTFSCRMTVDVQGFST